VVARLPGSDPKLRDEHVVFSAHLDHLGVSSPINGDGLYNGAMDNAAGVAGLLDIARSYKARGERPKRSMLFVFVTAEEKGLLGSRYFALRPTVAKRSMVANLNFDMALPIFPLKSVIALGAERAASARSPPRSERRRACRWSRTRSRTGTASCAPTSTASSRGRAGAGLQVRLRERVAGSGDRTQLALDALPCAV
jgi:Zn-dependent M28 family amino/carboxypeptidase